MHLRDALGPIYRDEDFAHLFPKRGRAAEAPWRLALITVLQAVENLSDRQAAEMVRGRLDWKYALSLPVDDTGFDASILTDFRQRLVAGQAQDQLLEPILQVCRERGWLKAGGKQRTDSTLVLANARRLSSLESVGETLRATLNDLAEIAPEWVLSVISPEWFDRYVHRFELQRFPKGKQAQENLIGQVGHDSWHLLQAVQEPQVPQAVDTHPLIALLKQVWDQHFQEKEGRVTWRDGPAMRNDARVVSPYDQQARESRKRSTEWLGYKVHLTETCGQEGQVNVIVNVSTTQATRQDVEETIPIAEHLQQRDLVPDEMLVDMGYTSGEMLVQYEQQGVRLIGPVQQEGSWQRGSGYGLDAFVLDWHTKQARCPQGQISRTWGTAGRNEKGEPRTEITFATKTCQACQAKALCTKQKKGRVLRPLPQAQYEAIEQRRAEQGSKAFQQEYAHRAGIESCLSEGVRRHGMRQSRYRGLPKTHLQMTAVAAAMNLVRLGTMLERARVGLPPRRPRPLSPFARLQQQLSA
jgi:transposase